MTKELGSIPAWVRDSCLLWPMSVAIQWGPKILQILSRNQSVKCEADHSFAFCAGIKNVWSSISTTPYIVMMWH